MSGKYSGKGHMLAGKEIIRIISLHLPLPTEMVGFVKTNRAICGLEVFAKSGILCLQKACDGGGICFLRNKNNGVQQVDILFQTPRNNSNIVCRPINLHTIKNCVLEHKQCPLTKQFSKPLRYHSFITILLQNWQALG